MILCCGEALIDMIPAKTASGEEAFIPYAGGSVFNTALALGRLNCTIFYIPACRWIFAAIFYARALPLPMLISALNQLPIRNRACLYKAD